MLFYGILNGYCYLLKLVCALELKMPHTHTFEMQKTPLTTSLLKSHCKSYCHWSVIEKNNFQNNKQSIMIRSGTYMVAANFLFRSLKIGSVVESCAFFEKWQCSVLVNSIQTKCIYVKRFELHQTKSEHRNKVRRKGKKQNQRSSANCYTNQPNEITFIHHTDTLTQAEYMVF